MTDNHPDSILDSILIILCPSTNLYSNIKIVIDKKFSVKELLEKMISKKWKTTNEKEILEILEKNIEYFESFGDKYFLSKKGVEASMNVSWF